MPNIGRISYLVKMKKRNSMDCNIWLILNSANLSNDLSILKNSFYLKVMQEAYDEHDCDWQKDETHWFKRHQFLKLHVVLVDSSTVWFLLFDCLVNFIDLVNNFVDNFTVFLLRQCTQIRKLDKNRFTSSPWKKLKVTSLSFLSLLIIQR